MLIITHGDIFESNAVALVNPVNTVGIMGKGLALKFKEKYPKNFINYKEKCKNKTFKIESDLVYTFENKKYIINFPTKKHWNENSKIEYIKIGLEKLEELVRKEKIESIAIPALGVGNGKLDWKLVKKEILLFEKKLTSVKIIVFEPNFVLNKKHLFIINCLIESYKNGLDKSKITLSVLQNLIFLGNLFNNSNYFEFENNKNGPNSNILKNKYQEIKNYCNNNNLKLNDLKSKIESNLSKNLINKEKESILKGIKLYKKIIKINNNTKNKNYLLVIYNILFIINTHTKSINLDQIHEYLINKKLMKTVTSSDFLSIINFLLENNILEENRLHNFKINKK